MMGPGCPMGDGTSMLLVSLAVGYGVLVLAMKQKRPVDIIGRVVAGIILIAALAGLICKASSAYCRYKSSCAPTEACDASMKKAMCPYSGKATSPAADTKGAPQKL
jgi:hypothetical protein